MEQGGREQVPGDLSELLGVPAGVLEQITSRPNNVDQDRYDQRLWHEVLQASQELSKLSLAPAAGEGDAAVRLATRRRWEVMLQDVWATYYKTSPDLVPEDQVDPDYARNRPPIERLQQDSATAEARLTTTLDELSSALATLAAGRKLLEEMHKDPEFDQTAPGLRRAIHQVAEAGQEEAEKLQAALAGWGMESADLQSVPLGERLKLAQRLLNPRMRKLADLVGRMRNLARARQRHKVKRERDEVHSITLGADLGRVLPAELAALRHPLRKLDFYRRFTEGQLLQYELRSRKAPGRGPIIALVDVSGSMNGAPLDWAIGTALALVDTAARQKRRAAVVFFNTLVQHQVVFQPGERSIEKLTVMAGIGAGGGTDYWPALETAVAMMNGQFRQADVVMITDGVCQLRPEQLASFLDAKKRMEFRTWSVLVGTDPYGELSKWSDKVWPVARLTEDVAGEIFEEVY